MNPITSTLIEAGLQSTAELRTRITAVRYGRAEDNEVLFDFDGVTYRGTLRGRTADAVLEVSPEWDASVALRVLLDGDAVLVSSSTVVSTT